MFHKLINCMNVNTGNPNFYKILFMFDAILMLIMIWYHIICKYDQRIHYEYLTFKTTIIIILLKRYNSIKNMKPIFWKVKFLFPNKEFFHSNDKDFSQWFLKK